MNDAIIVTSSEAIKDFFIECRLVDAKTPWLKYATIADVKNKKVYGTIPLHLACYTVSVTELQWSRPPRIKLEDVTLADIENDTKATFHTYIVKKINKQAVHEGVTDASN
jgi:hypothetical protein